MLSSMSLCELSAAHDAKGSVSVGAVELRASGGRLEEHTNGKTTSVSSGKLYGQSSTTAVAERQTQTNAHKPSGPRQNTDLAHPGKRFIDANSSKTSTNGPKHAEVPFAPRPAASVPRSGASNPTIPSGTSSSGSLRGSQSGSVPARTLGRPAPPKSSRKPAPTQPLAATAIDLTSSPATTPQPNKAGHNGLPPEFGSTSTSRLQVPSKPRSARSQPKKRPLSAVMEINKMMIPKDFSSQEDAYAKLPSLWTKTGNPDDICVNWTNPNAPSLWELTKVRNREVPAIPPSGTPASTSSESSMGSPAPSSPLTTGASLAARRARSRGPYVDCVYADSRYIGVSNKRAKLMLQSTKTRNKLGPLDHAQFRDYNLLPIDYFVAPMEGFQAEEAIRAREDEENKEEAQEGRPRRSRRQPQQARQPTPPPRDKKKKKKQVTKTSVFVGKNHQVDTLPVALKGAYRVDPNIYKDPSYVSDDVRDDQIWDPKRADEAERRGEDIEGFLRPARDLNSQALLLQALHQADYCVSKAELEFVDLYRASKEPSAEMSDEEKRKADALFETSRKDFASIAKKLNRSVGCVLAQYYYWKAMEKKEGKGGYMRLKNLWKNEDDVCCICDDGGILIVCEHCHKAFHLGCLKPKLKEAPKTDWYCNQCLKSPAKLRRMPSITLGTAPESPKTAGGIKPAAAKALSFSSPTLQLPNLQKEPGSQRGSKVIDLCEE